jgi:hypothetical protein
MAPVVGRAPLRPAAERKQLAPPAEPKRVESERPATPTDAGGPEQQRQDGDRGEPDARSQDRIKNPFAGRRREGGP